MGKRLPKTPSDLWKKKKTFMSPAELHQQMRQIVEEQKQAERQMMAKQPKMPNGKTMRDFRGK